MPRRRQMDLIENRRPTSADIKAYVQWMLDGFEYRQAERDRQRRMDKMRARISREARRINQGSMFADERGNRL